MTKQIAKNNLQLFDIEKHFLADLEMIIHFALKNCCMENSEYEI